ncbi:MAG: hypothetical protein ACYC7E_21050 [Armatimonadota bacterium]
MIDEMTVSSPPRRGSLAAALIGSVLSLWGIIALIGGGIFLMKLPMLLAHMNRMPANHPGMGTIEPVPLYKIVMVCVTNGLDALLGLLGLVVGIALLARAGWALKGARVALLITLISKVLFTLGWQILWPLVLALREYGWGSSVVTSYLYAVVLFLFNIAPYVAFYIVLGLPRVRAEWAGEKQSAGLSPVSLAAAVLMIGWAGAWLTSAWSNVGAMFNNPNYPRDLLILQETAFVICVLAIASAAGLLARQTWARSLAAVVLFLGMLTIAPYHLLVQIVLSGNIFLSGLSRMMGGGPQTLAFLGSMVNIFAGMLVYLVAAIFLLRDRPVKEAPVVVEESAEPVAVG